MHPACSLKKYVVCTLHVVYILSMKKVCDVHSACRAYLSMKYVMCILFTYRGSILSVKEVCDLYSVSKGSFYVDPFPEGYVIVHPVFQRTL